jgi:hypothetical protein
MGKVRSDLLKVVGRFLGLLGLALGGSSALALPVMDLAGQKVVVSEDISATYIAYGYVGNPAPSSFVSTVSSAGVEVGAGNSNPYGFSLGAAAYAALDVNPSGQVGNIAFWIGSPYGVLAQNVDWLITLDFPDLQSSGLKFTSVTVHPGAGHNSAFANGGVASFDADTAVFDLSGGYYNAISQIGLPGFYAWFSYTLGEADNNGTIPEPGSLALMGLGMAGLAWRRRQANQGA